MAFVSWVCNHNDTLLFVMSMVLYAMIQVIAAKACSTVLLGS